MRSADLVRKWLERRLTRFERSNLACGLAVCAESKRRWVQFLPNRNGVLLQGVYYCGRPCLETALAAQLSRLQGATPTAPPPYRIPLGLLMVARGWLTHEQVVQALAAQRSAHGGQIGEWFEKLGFATQRQVTAALALQWGCPVATSLSPADSLTFDRIPFKTLSRAYARQLGRLFVHSPDLGFVPSRALLALVGVDRRDLETGNDLVSADVAERAADRSHVVVEAL